VHRQTGPRGGQLAAVEETGLLAERTLEEDKPSLAVWRPIDRHRPEKWERITAGDVQWSGKPESPSVSFTWNRRIYSATFQTPQQERMELRRIADWELRPRLLQLPGVAEVLNIGGDRKQYQVLVDPDKLLEFNIGLPDVEAAIKANNLNKSGGFQEDGQKER